MRFHRVTAQLFGSASNSNCSAPAPKASPAGWPTYSPNESGLSRLVYAHMKDYCRRVARGVIVGKAYKKGVDQNAYFTLSLP